MQSGRDIHGNKPWLVRQYAVILKRMRLDYLLYSFATLSFSARPHRVPSLSLFFFFFPPLIFLNTARLRRSCGRARLRADRITLQEAAGQALLAGAMQRKKPEREKQRGGEQARGCGGTMVE
jgi:hypothetical protein